MSDRANEQAVREIDRNRINDAIAFVEDIFAPDCCDISNEEDYNTLAEFDLHAMRLAEFARQQLVLSAAPVTPQDDDTLATEDDLIEAFHDSDVMVSIHSGVLGISIDTRIIELTLGDVKRLCDLLRLPVSAPPPQEDP